MTWHIVAEMREDSADVMFMSHLSTPDSFPSLLLVAALEVASLLDSLHRASSEVSMAIPLCPICVERHFKLRLSRKGIKRDLVLTRSRNFVVKLQDRHLVLVIHSCSVTFFAHAFSSA